MARVQRVGKQSSCQVTEELLGGFQKLTFYKLREDRGFGEGNRMCGVQVFLLNFQSNSKTVQKKVRNE